MIDFDWSDTSQILETFGGQERYFRVPKTGLPYFDTLRLYGVIDLYVGLQDEVTIKDLGYGWHITAKIRPYAWRESKKRIDSATQLLEAGNQSSIKLQRLRQSLSELEQALGGSEWPITERRDVSEPLDKPDSALQNGIRGTAAKTYQGLETGSSKTRSEVAWVDALLAFAGQKRSESVSRIHFLPVFEGLVDFSKVVCPLRIWTNPPNVVCAQVLTLLALKTSLLAEGYADRLSAVVYNTRLTSGTSERPDNYSGIITLKSTALDRQQSVTPNSDKFGRFISHFYRTFRNLITHTWDRSGQVTNKVNVEDTLAHAYWLLQPNRSKYLFAMLTAIERQKRDGLPTIVTSGMPHNENYVEEIFMSYGNWHGDQESHEALRRFAKAVASGIYYARPPDSRKSLNDQRKERQKNWYDEVTLLRSAPSAKAFMERALILIEQGKRALALVGSEIREEDFDPAKIYACIGQPRNDFETFRDLFRMYLIQESKPYKAAETDGDDQSDQNGASAEAEGSEDEMGGEQE